MTDRALLVGVNAYPVPYVLKGCVNDSADLGWYIAGTTFAPEWITTLTDEAATASGIKIGLEGAIAQAEPGDRLLFTFAGHGAQWVDGDAMTDCLCPVDFDWDRPETAITSAYLHDLLLRLPEGVEMTMVIDACHSGDDVRAFSRKGREPRFYGMRPRVMRALPIAHHPLPRVALLAACRSDQTAADAVDENGRPCGAFTRHLLMVLKQAPLLSLTDLVAAVAESLADEGYEQVPQLVAPPELARKPFLATVCT